MAISWNDPRDHLPVNLAEPVPACRLRKQRKSSSNAFPPISFPRIYSIGEKQADQRRSRSRSEAKREVEKKK